MIKDKKLELIRKLIPEKLLYLVCLVLIFSGHPIHGQTIISGNLDPSFNYKSFSGIAVTTAIQSDGKILVGGTLTDYDGAAVGRLVWLNSDGTHDTGFTASLGTGFNNTVWSILVLPDGDIVVGGEFTSVNGTAAKYVTRLNGDGTLDITALRLTL
jgi:hypothetical protein